VYFASSGRKKKAKTSLSKISLTNRVGAIRLATKGVSVHAGMPQCDNGYFLTQSICDSTSASSPGLDRNGQ